MADVIERNEVRRRLEKIRMRTEQKPKRSEYRRGMLDALDYSLSAVDACEGQEVVTVTRCADCIHAAERDKTMVYCGFYRKHRDPTDYCNYGEKVY